MILGFDGSRDQNVFVTQKGLESKMGTILNRLSQMQGLSCSGGRMPTVQVSVMASTPSGPVEAFDFAEYQPELFEKFRSMRSQHPYVLTAGALKAYQSKFRRASPDSVKVRPGQDPAGALSAPARDGLLPPTCASRPFAPSDVYHHPSFAEALKIFWRSEIKLE